MVMLPLSGVFWLDLRANRDWELCFHEELRTPSMLQDYGEYLWSVVTHPVVILFSSAGFLSSAMLWALTRHWVPLVIWLFIVLFCAWVYSDPETWHDCDRKGSYNVFGVLLAQGVGVVLTLLAIPLFLGQHRINRPREHRTRP